MARQTLCTHAGWSATVQSVCNTTLEVQVEVLLLYLNSRACRVCMLHAREQENVATTVNEKVNSAQQTIH